MGSLDYSALVLTHLSCIPVVTKTSNNSLSKL